MAIRLSVADAKRLGFVEKKRRGGGKAGAEFSFEIEAEMVDEKSYLLILKGKHLSKNRINAMGIRNRIRYKKAMKRAAADGWFKYKASRRPPFVPFEKAVVEYVVYNPRSRDDDANYETLKILRDISVSYFRMMEDDTREVVVHSSEREVISDEYRVEMKIRKAG